MQCSMKLVSVGKTFAKARGVGKIDLARFRNML
jgi:hypothetical protein